MLVGKAMATSYYTNTKEVAMYEVMRELKFHELIGKEVYAVRGIKEGRKTKYISPKFVLFTDGETLIRIEDQDYREYHDCASSAKHFTIYQDKSLWSNIDVDKVSFPVANDDL